MTEGPTARLWLARTGIAGCILMAAIIVSSAYLRLTTMGIGCDPWPACYGHVQKSVQAAQPHATDLTPLSVKVARLAHRASAMLVAILAVLTVLLGRMRAARSAHNTALTVTLLGLTIVLAAVGRMSATLLVPAVGIVNLLGGFGLLACFWALRLNNDDRPHTAAGAGKPMYRMAAICLTVFVLQAAIGALISVTYSAALCPSLWVCDPSRAQAAGLDLFTAQPVDATAKVLPARAAASVQTTHRVLGVAAAALFALFGVWLMRAAVTRVLGGLLAALALIEAAVGIVMASHDFPLLAAMLHNALGALLLIVLVSLAWPGVAAAGHAVCDNADAS